MFIPRNLGNQSWKEYFITTGTALLVVSIILGIVIFLNKLGY